MKYSLYSLSNSRPHWASHTNLHSHRHFFSKKAKTGSDSLYRRISRLGDPRVSVVPVLDQWVQQGKSATREEIGALIKELISYKRYKHALEISLWMTDKRYIPLSPGDVAARMNLILRVYGIEQVEKYFNDIPQNLIGFKVYTALLNCYAHDKSVEKAEDVMQKLREMGWATTALCYNIMMNLYYQTDCWEKLDPLMHEMEEKGISFDSYTLTIRLSAYAAASDGEGIDKVVAKMESDPSINLDFSTYSVAAKGYLKVGLVDKAVVMLNKLEGLTSTAKTRNVAFDCLIKLYAEAGKRDEVYRIWYSYKGKVKIYNKGYMSMMGALLKFNDIEGAEKIFKEWESKGLSCDFRIPNFLIDGYCRNGLIGKAEAILNKGIAKGGNPTATTWYYLAGAYIEQNQIQKAVEALRKSLLVCLPNWKPLKDILPTCIEYLERQGDTERADKFVEVLKENGVFSAVAQERLLNFVKDGKSES